MKKLIAILLALVLALSLCACGSSDTEEVSAETETAETETTEAMETESAEEPAEEPSEETVEAGEVPEDEPEAAASGEPSEEASGEPAAAPADSGDVPTPDDDCDYIIELARDDVAAADIALAVGETVKIGLNYTGQDSTVDFSVTDSGDTSIATVEDDLVMVSVTGTAAGSTTATLAWTAVNTSGSTYTVQLNITVS
ncbi:MAG: hypothetical protein LUE21_07235 [Oscillospiraceae bacterium]|nr:hypothetical protein [Oscillospiraceae bacterium]